MSIPVEIVGGGIDWPAWVQAVGSIIAIVVSAGLAIAIDQGTARRQVKAEERARVAMVAEWESCFASVVALTSNAAQLAANEKPGRLENDQPERLIANATGMIDAYLRHLPPSARLAFALSSARSYLAAPAKALKGLRQVPQFELATNEDLRNRLTNNAKSSLRRAAERTRALHAEYKAGLW